MELSCFSYQVRANVGHLVLNRPAALNTMSPTFWRELEAVLGELHRHSAGVRALVLSSTGKHFSAGMALETFGAGIAMDDSAAAGRANIVDELLDMQQVFNQLEALRLPVICAIQGGCIGGALDMAAACDIRWCTADAFFCIQEINIGMVADLGSLQRLPKLMSHSLLRELAYTGRRLPAAKALASGLVSEVFDTQEQMLEAALACAAEIAGKPPVAIAGSKRALNYARDHSVRDSLEQMALLQAGFWQTDNLKLAIGARKGEAAQFEDLRPIQRFAER
ncbi:enoyl-CoA hydratase-related protein [Methylibium rhizosphaerae]|uniref:enoyl-CoA hydratase-related protein n=1 Tax=Methylibium rhizosphaerae TaxID=2570323 RepID=UPI00112CD561|nr:enoyl-CoA hydratase-related protein [Methylibium rhizosphaerae]